MVKTINGEIYGYTFYFTQNPFGPPYVADHPGARSYSCGGSRPNGNGENYFLGGWLGDSGATVLLNGITVGVVVDINGWDLRPALFLPVRFYYMLEERNLNRTNAEAAISRLDQTNYSEADGQNSAWSKPWVIQGTGKPW